MGISCFELGFNDRNFSVFYPGEKILVKKEQPLAALFPLNQTSA